MENFICYICKNTDSLFISTCYHLVCSACLFFNKNIIKITMSCPICSCQTEFREFKYNFNSEILFDNFNILLVENTCLKKINAELKNTIKKYKELLKEVYFKMKAKENHEHK